MIPSAVLKCGTDLYQLPLPDPIPPDYSALVSGLTCENADPVELIFSVEETDLGTGQKTYAAITSTLISAGPSIPDAGARVVPWSAVAAGLALLLAGLVVRSGLPNAARPRRLTGR